MILQILPRKRVPGVPGHDVPFVAAEQHIDGVAVGQLWAFQNFIFPIHQEVSTILLTNQYHQILMIRPDSIS